MAYSGIYNLYIYQGIADELGGRGKFFSQVDCASRKQRLPDWEAIEDK
jgi:hypothetical protein